MRHVIAGGAGTLIYFFGTALLVELAGIPPTPASGISFFFLVFYTYVVNAYWVHPVGSRHLTAVPKFIAVIAISFSINISIMYVAVDLLELWYYWGLAVATIVIPTTNFVLNKAWVFKE